MIEDRRKVVGSRISAKAIHVTNLAECARRYGANKKTKVLYGTVVEHVSQRNNPNSRRVTNIIVGDFDLGSGVLKQASLNIRSVKAVEPPPVPEMPHDNEEVAAAVIVPDGAVLDNVILDASNTIVNDGARELAVEEVLANEVVVDNDHAVGPVVDAVADEVAAEESGDGGDIGDSENGEGVPAAVAHDTEWFLDDRATLRTLNSRRCNEIDFKIKDQIGNTFSPGDDRSQRYSRLDYFLMMFPPKQLNEMIRLTNISLLRGGINKCTSKGEMLKLFGVMILVTKFEFTTRAKLWSNTAPNKYIPAPAFGKTGMSRPRFDDLMRHLVYSEQPEVRPEGMSHEKYRWLLVDGFVELFNDHREIFFEPSDMICADESISRWYGQGGHWINIGLPMYMAIDRKPENGCEIQNCCCGRSGIMMRLKLVKTAEEEATHVVEGEDGILHGTRILLFLVDPWAYSGRTVVGDSYFASVGAAEQLDNINLGFIGVVKTATKKFPMQYLSGLELENRGDRRGVIFKQNQIPRMMAFVWMDRNRRYFISTSASLEEGNPYERERWRQVDSTPNADAERVTVTVPQPKVCEIYYSSCAKIDQHNRCRQQSLDLEKKLEVKEWSARVNMSLLAMCIVDSWLAFTHCTESSETQKDYYMHLAEELIDNCYDNDGPRRTRKRSRCIASPDGELLEGPIITPHIIATTRKRRCNGIDTNHLLQGRCLICSKKTSSLCSQCNADRSNDDDETTTRVPWICDTKSGRECFLIHLCEHQ